MKQFVTGCCLAGLATLASAGPVALSISSGAVLQAYTGGTAVNAGLVDDDGTLWTIAEQAHDGLQSWYVFYDPLNPRRLRATIDFGAPIVAVYTTREDLVATQADWRIDVDADGLFDDYAWRPLMGLESEDVVSWTLGGTTLTLDWRADDPGDHIRVLVQPAAGAVPEPGSAALVLAALGAAAAASRRRRG